MKTSGSLLLADTWWKSGCTKHISTILLALFSVILMVGCSKTNHREYHLVKAYGNGKIANFTKTNIFSFTECSMVTPGGIMMSQGDLVWIGNWVLVLPPEKTQDNATFRFLDTDSILILDNEVTGLRIDTGIEYNKMISLVDTPSIQSLQVLSLSNAGCQMHKKVIEKMASINPNISLGTDVEISDEDLSWLLSLFNPTFLAAELSQSQFALLKNETQISTLNITLARDSNFTCNPLPPLSNLKNLIISGQEVDSVSLTDQLLRNNPQIESLTLTSFENSTASGVLKPLRQPLELVLIDVAIPYNEVLAHKSTLERLLTDSLALQNEVPNLRWAMVGDGEESGGLLDSLAKSKSSLEVLEINANRNPLNLASMHQLKALKALSINDGDSLDLSPVKTMTQLRLLSYSTHEGNDDSTLAVLKASLPNTLVVPSDGLCVGSGWLLLWLPAMAFVIMMAKRHRV